MKRNPTKFLTVLLSLFLVFSFVFATSVSARILFERPRVLHEQDEATSSATKREQAKQRVHDRLEKLKEKFEARLEARKEKLCERVEAKITKRSEQLVNRANRMTDRFDKIAERVKEYYTEKLIPPGATIDNYDALVADVTAKGAAVDEALANAGSSIDEFDCNGDTPKGILALFRGDMRSVIAALKDHRTAVVNLIVAVRTKGKNIKSPGATESAEPATGSAEPE